jgi:sugar (pentulose or hexulose) kinase
MRPPVRQPAWLGIDAGTQSLRAALVDADGRLLGSGTAPLAGVRPEPGHHEQDPESWWIALGRATREALAGARDARPAVGAVAICSTSGTLLLSDDSGRVRSPALMYDDRRAGAQARLVAAAAASVAELTRRDDPDADGRRAHPSSSVGLLLWLLEHDDGAAAARAEGAAGAGGAGGAGQGRHAGGLHLTHCADLLAGRLVGGRVATDWSHALKSGYDPELRAWREELFEALGVPPSVLPEVVAPGAPLGVLTRGGARHTGLTAGTPVLAGMTDSCAAQIAAGALAPGSWNSVLGTTLAVKGVCAEPIVDPGAGVYSHRHPDGRGWLAGGASNVGAGVLSARFAGRDLGELDAAAAAHEPAAAVLYPLTRPGERFPFERADARPITLGCLGDEADHFAALLQGIAFVERLCLARMQELGARIDGPLRLTGGAARSDYWCQLRSDILGRPVSRPAHPEPAVGMAILACAEGGSVTEAAVRMVHDDLQLEPRVEAIGRFEDAYGRLCDELAACGYLDFPERPRRARPGEAQ